jgi:hypothetical protein
MSTDNDAHVLAAGDIAQVLVDASPDGEDEQLSLDYAVINEVTDGDGDVFVQYLEESDDVVIEDGEEVAQEDLLKLSDRVYAAPRASINRVWPIDETSADTLCKTMRAAGLQPLAPDDAPDDAPWRYFERLTDPDDDFVVSDNDSDAEPFHPADAAALSPNAAAFVRDTHDAVGDFNRWEPETVQELGIKRFVEDLAGRAEHENEHRRFCAGCSPIQSYKNPGARRT